MTSDRARGRALARALRLGWRVTCTSLEGGALPISMPDIVITLGPSLADAGAAGQAARVVDLFRSRRVPVLCLVEHPLPDEAERAAAMGVSMLLPAGAPVQLVADQLRSLAGGRRTNDPDAILRAAVQDVGFALADLMEAAASGLRVDPVLAERAGRLLLEALVRDGFDRWLSAAGPVNDQTYRHCLLVAGITASFVLQLGFNQADSEMLTQGAILHDIGKALIPPAIIAKPGRLTSREHAVMRRHAALGHELLVAQGGHQPQILDIVRHHHERLDGSGYPDRLSGDQISDAVRIVSIGDVFAALLEHRSYKPGLPAERAFVLLDQMRGKLDPDLLNAFCRFFRTG